MAHGEHVKGVGLAGMAVNELQAALAEAQSKRATALALVVAAVGEDPTADPARRALGTAQQLEVHIENTIQVCNGLIEDLNEYATGWM